MDFLRNLAVKIGFQVDNQKLSKLEGQLDSIKHRLSFLAGVEAAKFLFHLGEKFADIGEQIHIAALSAGIGVEAFQKLAFAANQNGVSNEELSRSLGLLSKHLYDARMGSQEAQKAFAQAGFTPEQVNGFHNASDAILALSDRMRAEKDPIRRAALGRELLGRNSQRMALFLGEGSKALKEEGEEAKRLGLIISGPQIKALEDLDHSLKKVFGLFKAFSAMIAADIAPSIKFLIDKFLELWAVNKDLIQLNVENWLQMVGYAMGFVGGLIYGLIIQFKKLAEVFHIDKDVLVFASIIIGLAGAFSMLGKALAFVAAVGGPIVAFFAAWTAAPIWLIVAAVGALALAVHDVWAAWNGKPQWGATAIDYVKGLLGFTAGPQQLGQGAVTGVQAASAMPSFGGAAAAAGSATSNMTNNFTFNVPQGTNTKEVGDKVIKFLQDKMDTQRRETGRVLNGNIAR